MTIILNDNIVENQKFSFNQTRNILSYNIEFEYADYSILPIPTVLVIKDENNKEIINITVNSDNIYKTVFDNYTIIRLIEEI